VIKFVTTLAEVSDGEVRAGGTDLSERRRSGVAATDVYDLRDVAGLDTLVVDGSGARIGAKVTVAAVGSHAQVMGGWRGFGMAAAGLATPQIRNVATVGGNLAQRPRCWYFRDPGSVCLKKGGGECLARAGDHLYHAVFDLSPCVAVHASTLACALLAYDGSVVVYRPPLLAPPRVKRAEVRSMAEFLGDGRDPQEENALEDGDLVTEVRLGAPVAGEKATYYRAIARARAEWPLVEVVARRWDGGARVAVGGVANVPLRLENVERAIMAGASATEAAEIATQGATPLPMTRYKVDVLRGAVLTALEELA
jgi:xanthine dehydrogenase YagS FAD-binding subunit